MTSSLPQCHGITDEIPVTPETDASVVMIVHRLMSSWIRSRGDSDWPVVFLDVAYHGLRGLPP